MQVVTEKKILVTGCDGLVGHGITYYLLNKGFSVTGTSRNNTESAHPNLSIVKLDLLSGESIANLESFVASSDAVIHNAAKIPKGEKESMDVFNEYFQANTIGTFRLLQLCEKYSRPFVYISGTRLSSLKENITPEEVPYNNKSCYDTSKLCAELICNQYILQKTFPCSILRISAPYGYLNTSNAVIPLFLKKIQLSEELVLYGKGEREQTFTFVQDIGMACQLAIEKQITGVFNITGGESVSMKHLAESIIKLFPETRTQIKYIEKKEDLNRNNYPIDKAKKVMGYSPVFNLAKGLNEIKEYMTNPEKFRILQPLYLFQNLTQLQKAQRMLSLKNLQQFQPKQESPQNPKPRRRKMR